MNNSRYFLLLCAALLLTPLAGRLSYIQGYIKGSHSDVSLVDAMAHDPGAILLLLLIVIFGVSGLLLWSGSSGE